MKLNQNRSQLRGKELDEDCHGAVISTNEFGINDNRKFCFKRPGGTILECMKNIEEILKEEAND